MKSWLITALALFGFAFVLGCDDSSANSGAIVVSQAQNGGTIAPAAGETFTVQLAGNPTTGYEWTVAQIDAAYLRLIDSSYAADSSAVGSGGVYTFQFETLQPGATTLGLVYRRSWETTPADQAFTLTVNIQGAAAGDDSSASLENTQWKLAAWSASSLDPAGFDITADFAGNRIGGRSAVNTYGGDYSASPAGAFAVGLVAMTEMAGAPDAMQAESLYHSLLGQADHWRRANGQLILSANAADLLIFNPR